jgi:hypothetical protein
MTRLARGSMPWPTPSASDQPACRGALTVEEQIDPGTRLRLTAWPRSGPDRAQAAAKEAGLAFKFLDEQVETLSRCPRNTGVLERGRSPERLAQPSNDRSRGARTRSARGGFRQHFLVCPFAWRDRVLRIDTNIWPAACVDTDPTSCAQRLTFAGK